MFIQPVGDNSVEPNNAMLVIFNGVFTMSYNRKFPPYSTEYGVVLIVTGIAAGKEPIVVELATPRVGYLA